MRAARLYSYGILASFALLALLSRAGTSGFTKFAASALESASMVVAGLSAWACAADLSDEDRRDGVAALAGVHGVNTRTLECWRTVGAVVRTALAIAAPAVGVILAGALMNGALLWAFALCLASVAYGFLLAGSLVPLARLAAISSKGHGKLLLLLCVAGPELLHVAGTGMPSWSSVFGALLHELSWLGRALS